jgi:hypothetical protein
MTSRPILDAAFTYIVREKLKIYFFYHFQNKKQLFKNRKLL